MVKFETIKFTNIVDGEETTSSYGYLIYDKYGAYYSSDWDKESIKKMTPEKALEIIKELDYDGDTFYGSIIVRNGFNFNGRFIELTEPYHK